MFLKFNFSLNFKREQAAVVGPGFGLDSGNFQRFLRFHVFEVPVQLELSRRTGRRGRSWIGSDSEHLERFLKFQNFLTVHFHFEL